MLSTKNNNNNSSIFGNTIKCEFLEAENIYNKTEIDTLIGSGSGSTDLSNYYNKTDIDNNFYNKYHINQNYYTAEDCDVYFVNTATVYNKAYINSVVNGINGNISTISGTVNN